MRGQGRAAALPPEGWRRPARIDETGLIVSPVGQHGEPLGIHDFTDSPGGEAFRRELVAAFAARGRGSWNAEGTYRTRASELRKFLTWAAQQTPPLESIADLTPARWKQWRLREPRGHEIRILVEELPGLPEATKAAMGVRIRKPKPKTKQGFSRSELKTIQAAAAKTVRTARLRIAQNAALLESWRAGDMKPGSEQERWGALLDQLARTGDFPRYPCGQLLMDAKALTRGEGFAGAVTRLFPSEAEMGAAMVLMVCHEAWNLSVIQKMMIPSQWPNADGDQPQPAVHHVDTDKPRRGRRRRHGTNNLVNVGVDSAGWALQQVLDMTAQARATAEAIGGPATSLFLARRVRATPASGLFCDGSSAEWAIQGWVRHMRAADPAFPDGVSVSPIRHSVQALGGGPRNNTEAVHRDVYVMRDENVRDEAADVVADGLADAVAQAKATVRMRVVGQATGRGEHDAQQIAKQTGLDEHTAAAVATGRLDTAVASCTDFEHSPFTSAGPCTASFLLCFACPNALATGRHLPRIAYLHQGLEALRSAVSAKVWKTDWAEHHARVEDLLDRHATPSARPGLLAELTDRDKDLVDRMLERRLDA